MTAQGLGPACPGPQRQWLRECGFQEKREVYCIGSAGLSYVYNAKVG